MVVLLRIGGNCSHFRAKSAHISGHLPSGAADDGKKAKHEHQGQQRHLRPDKRYDAEKDGG